MSYIAVSWGTARALRWVATCKTRAAQSRGKPQWTGGREGLVNHSHGQMKELQTWRALRRPPASLSLRVTWNMTWAKERRKRTLPYIHVASELELHSEVELEETTSTLESDMECDMGKGEEATLSYEPELHSELEFEDEAMSPACCNSCPTYVQMEAQAPSLMR